MIQEVFKPVEDPELKADGDKDSNSGGNSGKWRKKPKKKKKSKKGKKKRGKDNGSSKAKSEPSDKSPTTPRDSPTKSPKKSATKEGTTTGCFSALLGGISRWWGKHEDRRRQKRRDALESRRRPLQPLVTYDYTKSRGGVAFTIEVDKRPMTKPVLPPIKGRPQTARRDYKSKQLKAEDKRKDELDKKRHQAADYVRKRAEAAEKRFKQEEEMRKRTVQALQAKQNKAERNRSLLRAPSTLPPVRVQKKALKDNDTFRSDSSKRSPSPYQQLISPTSEDIWLPRIKGDPYYNMN